MSSIKLFKIAIWIILTFIVNNISFNMINSADTILNIIGILLLFIYIIFSSETKCLTNINFKKIKKMFNKNKNKKK